MVAKYELARALRTRLVQVVVLGYAVAMLLGDWIFVEALSIAEIKWRFTWVCRARSAQARCSRR